MLEVEPLFSVVIPLYNKEPYISRAIKSVLNQDYCNYEIIIINDASTDSGVDQVRQFNDCRIRLLHRDKPGPGGYAARNLGIKMAKGSWVAFLDADDEWRPNHLEKLKELTVLFPDTYLLSSGWQTSDSGEKFYDPFFAENNSSGALMLSLIDYLNKCLDNKRPVWSSVSAIRKDSPISYDLFPEAPDIKRGGDKHAWLKMICYHKSLAWSNHIGATYHRDSLNMVTKSSPAVPNLMNRNYYNELLNYLSPEEKKMLTKYFNKRIKSVWFEYVKKGNTIKDIRKYIYYYGDYKFACFLFFFSYLPLPIFRFLLNTKAYYSRN